MSQHMKDSKVASTLILILSAAVSSGAPNALAAETVVQTGTSATAATEGSLNLANAMNEARSKNPDLKRAQAAEGEASWAPLEALSGNLPHVQVTANHLFNAKFQVLDFAGGQVPLVAPYTLASIDLSWTVFDGFRSINAFRAAKKNASAAELQLSRTRFALDETVRLRFYQALGAQILADVAQQNVHTLQDHLQKTREILNRGSATKFDLLRVQVQLEEAVSEKSAADDNVVLARRNLALAMGMDNDNRALTGELPVPDEAVLPADLKADFADRTDLEALRKRAEAADNLHTASMGRWIPSVTFTAEKQYYNNIDKDITSPYRDAYAVGVGLTWNVFDGGATIARNAQTHYQAQEAEAAAESANLSAPQEFETFKRRYLYNSGLYRARRRAVDMAQESVRLATLGYNAGTRTSTDVLDAELDLIRARAGVVRAQVDGSEALINLELAVGKGLTK